MKIKININKLNRTTKNESRIYETNALKFKSAICKRVEKKVKNMSTNGISIVKNNNNEIINCNYDNNNNKYDKSNSNKNRKQ